MFSSVASLFGFAPEQTSAALASPSTILVLQLVVLALGVAGSAYTIHRITNRRYASLARRTRTKVPYLVLLGVLAVMNTYLFLLPMAHRV